MFSIPNRLASPWLSVFFGFVLMAGFASARAESKPRRQPNIIFILTDDLGFEKLGSYGGRFSRDGKTVSLTPNLDALASQGVRFSHCYATPYCTPSRVQMMSGRYAHRSGAGVRLGQWPKGEISYASYLKTAGYRTAVLGKWQLSASTTQLGFDEANIQLQSDAHWFRYINGKTTDYQENGVLVTVPDPKNTFLTDYELGWISAFLERNRDRPFLLHYTPWLIHYPANRTPDSPDRGGADKPDEMFQDMLLYLDKAVGQLLQKLDQLGLREDTIVVFSGDNGSEWQGQMINGQKIPSGKHKCIEFGCRVPLIVSWKGHDAPGTVCNDLIDYTDLAVTLLQAADVPPPQPPANRMDGTSFLPQILGQPGQPRSSVFLHYFGGSTKWPPEVTRWARDGRYKLYKIVERSNPTKYKSPTDEDKLDGVLFDVESDPFADSDSYRDASGKKGKKVPFGGRINPPYTPEQEAARVRLQAVIDGADTFQAPLAHPPVR